MNFDHFGCQNMCALAAPSTCEAGEDSRLLLIAFLRFLTTRGPTAFISTNKNDTLLRAMTPFCYEKPSASCCLLLDTPRVSFLRRTRS
jgi:hypothetical protein